MLFFQAGTSLDVGQQCVLIRGERDDYRGKRGTRSPTFPGSVSELPIIVNIFPVDWVRSII